MKPVFIVAIVAIVGAISWQLFFQNESQPSPAVAVPPATVSIPEGAIVVTLTPDGFVPAEVTIQKGQTIAFNTTTKNLFWPASNLHPSHTIYPEFDPLEPVQPGAMWSFTFTKTGEWKFHDHLAPYFTGVITVVE
jgi:plastocyanin